MSWLGINRRRGGYARFSSKLMWIVKQKYSPCRLQCCFFYMCRRNNVCDNINHRDDVFASSSREASNTVHIFCFCNQGASYVNRVRGYNSRKQKDDGYELTLINRSSKILSLMVTKIRHMIARFISRQLRASRDVFYHTLSLSTLENYYHTVLYIVVQ